MPYGLLSPGVLWLLLFFLVPLVTLARTSLSVKNSRFDPNDIEFTWEFSTYTNAISDYSEQFLRSFAYAGAATMLCIAIGYPMAYVIAFRGGRYRNLLLGLVVVPFFTSFLIRTLAWVNVLSDQGPVISHPRPPAARRRPQLARDHERRAAAVHPRRGDRRAHLQLPAVHDPADLREPREDRPRAHDAAKDLYNNGWQAFRKVVLPLSLPGVFAGSLLTFIPAAGDFINAEFLGGPNNTMIGSVIQDRFLVQGDIPTAAALSFILMVIITIGVLIYARVLGTDDLV